MCALRTRANEQPHLFPDYIIKSVHRLRIFNIPIFRDLSERDMTLLDLHSMVRARMPMTAANEVQKPLLWLTFHPAASRHATLILDTLHIPWTTQVPLYRDKNVIRIRKSMRYNQSLAEAFRCISGIVFQGLHEHRISIAVILDLRTDFRFGIVDLVRFHRSCELIGIIFLNE